MAKMVSTTLYRGRSERLGHKEHKARKERREILVRRALLVLKAKWELQELMAKMAKMGIRSRGRKVLPARLELPELKETPAPLVQPERLALKGQWGLAGMVPMARTRSLFLAHKGQSGSLVRQEPLGRKESPGSAPMATMGRMPSQSQEPLEWQG